jgi:hypothetical protein
MKSNQKFYDLAFLTINNSLIRTNPLDYYKNIQIIRARKTQYPSFEKFNINRIEQIPFKNHYVIESNKKYKFKIKEIRMKPVIPMLNSDFIDLDKRIKINKERNKFVKARATTLENNKYKKRIKEQKPKVIKADLLQKLFTENHDKYLEILLRNSRFRKRELKLNEQILSPRLPHIFDNKCKFMKKYRSKTEWNLNAKDNSNDNSKDNSLVQNDHKHMDITHEQQGHDIKDNK